MKKEDQNSKYNSTSAPSSEELYIQNYLEDIGISYKREYPLFKLKGDDKSFRKADFYLPRFGIYIEYFGLYNSTKARRAEYDKKVDIYLRNGLPTVFLYPHELGFLDYAFHNKALKILKLPKFHSKRRILKYKFVRYWAYGGVHLLFVAFVSFFLSVVFLFKDTGLTEDVNTWLYALFFGVFFVSLGHFFIDFYKYFVRNK